MRPLHTTLLLLCFVVSTIALVMAVRQDDPPKLADNGLEERVKGLEEALRSIERSLAQATQSDERRQNREPSGAHSTDVVSLGSRVQALEESVSRWSGNPALALDTELSPLEVERTRQALEVIEREGMEARVTRWISRERGKANALAELIGQQLNLSRREHEALTEILADEGDGQGKLLSELWGATPPENPADEVDLAKKWDESAAQMKELRKTRDKKLVELLGADRYEKMQHLAKESLRANRSKKRRKQ